MENRAVKYRIYPNRDQRILFLKTFGCCRKVWNLMLEDKISYYKETGKTLMTTPAQYKREYPYLKEVDALALANVQLNLQAAYKHFFGKRNRFPKFKSERHSRKSYTTNNQNGTVALLENGIRLPKAGVVKAKIHRMPEETWKVKSATVSLDSDGKYYASVLFAYEEENSAISIDANTALGLDYKSDGLYMDSDGEKASGHKYFRESQEKLAKAQRRFRHKITGSKNYKKQQIKVGKIYRQGANRRKDFLHKKSAEITLRQRGILEAATSG